MNKGCYNCKYCLHDIEDIDIKSDGMVEISCNEVAKCGLGQFKLWECSSAFKERYEISRVEQKGW